MLIRINTSSKQLLIQVSQHLSQELLTPSLTMKISKNDQISSKLLQNQSKVAQNRSKMAFVGDMVTAPPTVGRRPSSPALSLFGPVLTPVLTPLFLY